MRKTLWLPAIVVAVVPLAAEAQGTGTALTWGLMGGVNLAKMTGEGLEDAEARLGFDLGLTAQKQLNATWSFNTGAHWTTKGAKFSEMGVSATTTARYLEVPVLFRRTKESGEMKPFIEFGSAVAFNLSCNSKATMGGASVSVDCGTADEEVKKLDLGLVGGAGIELTGMGRPWTLGVRYNKGVTKIADAADAPKNTNLQFLLGFRFK